MSYAQSFGAHGYQVNTLDEFRAAFAQALHESGPSIIDARVDYRNNLNDLMADLESDVLQ